MAIPATIRVCMFGPFELRRGEDCIRLGLSGRTLDLLRYMLVHAHRPLRPDYLAEMFWRRSSWERRRSALNSAVWRIRGALAPLGGFEVWRRDGAIGLDLGPNVSVDVIELGRAFEAANAEEVGSQERLARLLDLCEAPFLDGAAEDWAIVEREKFFELRMRGLALLLRRAGQAKRYDDALGFGARLLAEDPYREGVHCEMMWLYVLSGRRAKALAQYERCAEILRRELDIEPMAELRALYNHIRNEVRDAAPAPAPSRPGDLDGVLDAIERSRTEVYEALCAQFN